VVLKSLFEEQIRMESEHSIQAGGADNLYTEAQDYISNYTREHSLNQYLNFIRDVKKEVSIPIIASINCVTSEEWPSFAQKIEKAGADAIELNVFILPSDFTRGNDDNENVYFKVVEEVKRYVNIPVALKISYYFTNLAQMIQRLSFTGVSGLVLFNRFFSPDIDLKNMTVVPSNLMSEPSEISTSLRWIAIMAERVKCDLCASTGVHDGLGVAKQILAGADAVQVVSTLYKNKSAYLKNIVSDFENWMKENKFEKIDDFKGKMSQIKSKNPASFERVQFMKYFSEII
jgi:dihydroorotate dehydrogenase (fumarate)